jgi:hypothetical protein
VAKQTALFAGTVAVLLRECQKCGEVDFSDESSMVAIATGATSGAICAQITQPLRGSAVTMLGSVASNHRPFIELSLGIVLPPIVLALSITVVRINNRYFRRISEPDTWLTLFKLYCVAVIWLELYAK